MKNQIKLLCLLKSILWRMSIFGSFIMMITIMIIHSRILLAYAKDIFQNINQAKVRNVEINVLQQRKQNAKSYNK